MFFVLFAPVLALAVSSKPSAIIYAIGIFIAGIPFYNLIIKQGVLPSVSLNAILYVVAFLVSIKLPKKNPSIAGHQVLLLIIVLSLFNLFRTIDVIPAVVYLMGLLSFYLILYSILPRLNVTDGHTFLMCFIFGWLLYVLFLFSTYDWRSSLRLGLDVGVNANNIGLYMSFAIVSILFLIYHHLAKLWSVLFLIACLYGLFLTGSRTALIAMVVAVIGFLIFERKVKVLLLSALVLGLLLFSINVKQLVENTDVKVGVVRGFGEVTLVKRGNMYSASKGRGNIFAVMSSMRYQIYQKSIPVFYENWFLGVGLGNFQEIVRLWKYDNTRLMVAHSMFLLYAVEMGLLGLILVLLWFYLLFKDALRKRQSLVFGMLSIFFIVGLLAGNVLHIEYGLFALYIFLLQSYHSMQKNYQRLE